MSSVELTIPAPAEVAVTNTAVAKELPGVAEYIRLAVDEYPAVAQILIRNIKAVAAHYQPQEVTEDTEAFDLHLEVYNGSLIDWAIARLMMQLSLSPSSTEKYTSIAQDRRALLKYKENSAENENE